MDGIFRTPCMHWLFEDGDENRRGCHERLRSAILLPFHLSTPAFIIHLTISILLRILLPRLTYSPVISAYSIRTGITYRLLSFHD